MKLSEPYPNLVGVFKRCFPIVTNEALRKPGAPLFVHYCGDLFTIIGLPGDGSHNFEVRKVENDPA